MSENGLNLPLFWAHEKRPMASHAQAKETSNMPMDYLRTIENAQFPLRVESTHDINNVAVLKAAGLVDAEISGTPADSPSPGEPEVAVVSGITPLGRKALADHREGGNPTKWR